MLLSHLLTHVVRIGTLKVIDAGGKLHTFSGAAGPQVTIRLHTRAVQRALLLNPELALGEAYMDGTMTIEEGQLSDLFEIMAKNEESARSYPLYALRARSGHLLRRWQQYNPIGLAKKNVAHHYDLPDRLYDLFLDGSRQYSCAYFLNDDDDLAFAQVAKERHLAAKLLLEPGQKVLDIGSGWGGLAFYLAKEGKVDVTGLTLSESQLKFARQRAGEYGLEQQVNFQLRDYREQTGTFDRIVSVGMFEHVGVNQYEQFFATIGNLLDEDGVCVLHAIGRMEGPANTSEWMRKYIFPGGYSPALSETLAVIEKSGLWVTDIEVLRVHYAQTLKAWRRRFQANRARIAEMIDERFCRMWDYYLTASEAAFRHSDHFVFQIQLAKKRDAVPLTRDYIAEWERAHPISINRNKPKQVARQVA
ncbi:Cyclopropane-fatty-acyl-phospholipid synthase [hydrothermal vent metagenome]|uniref:Cyclopropane-fatty-acyl-phospholipid synthase n=1 Tax=hydrothermal vent metagenome TaxID=652676 RepID=A0A3B0SBS0_9ZZZZ